MRIAEADRSLWRDIPRQPVSVAAVPGISDGTTYRQRPLEMPQDNRGAHAAQRVVWSRLAARGARGIVGRQWLAREDAKLVEWRRQGVPWMEIAERLGRTGIACEKRFGTLMRKGAAE